MSRSIIDQNSFSDQNQGYSQNKKGCLSHPKMYWTKCKKYKQKQRNSNQNQVIQRSISLISTLNDYSILEKQISKIAEQSSRNQTNNYSFDNIFHTKTQKNKSKIHCNNLSYIFKWNLSKHNVKKIWVLKYNIIFLLKKNYKNNNVKKILYVKK